MNISYMIKYETFNIFLVLCYSRFNKAFVSPIHGYNQVSV